MNEPFASLRRTPQEHFKLRFYGTILRLRERLSHLPAPDDPGPLVFLGGYFAELEQIGFPPGQADAVARWEDELGRWERRAKAHLPLHALSEAAGLEADALTLLVLTGLVEEDPRFGLLFDALHVLGVPGFSATVFDSHRFDPPRRSADLLALPREPHDMPEEIFDADWRVA